MPTAAKLFAAVTFALVAFAAAEVFKTTMTERTVWGAFSLYCAGVGALCGWFVMGPRAGRGYGASLGTGLRTSVTVVFWLVLAFSIYEMVILSTKMRYDGPMDAILGMFALMLQHGRALLTQQVMITLFAGGLLGGAMAEFAGRRWR